MTTTNSFTTTHLTSLSGLKLIAVIGILACHTSLIPAFDACARMVEVLFVISGFLMAYNYQNKETKDFTALTILKRKLKKLFPIHLITFLLQLFFVGYWAEKTLNFKFTIGILNLSFMHAWFKSTEFSFNNVSWFLSALLFCYIITPTLKSVLKKHSPLLIFTLITSTRFYLEYTINTEPRSISLDLHCNPFIQSLNYSLGYIVGTFFTSTNPLNTMFKEKLKFFEHSLLEILIYTLYILCCIKLDNFYRIFFILLALPLVYLSAHNQGIISKFLSLSFIQKSSTLTLELFMFHSFILYHFPTDKNNPLTYLTFMLLTIAVSLIYRLITTQILKKQTPKA